MDPTKARRRRRAAPVASAALVTVALAATAGGVVEIGSRAAAPTASATTGDATSAKGSDSPQGGPGDSRRGPGDQQGGPGGPQRAAGNRRGRSGNRPQRDQRGPERTGRSVAAGTHADGSLKRGVPLPAKGLSWVSWDPILKRRPSREWRRWGTQRLISTTLGVLREFGRTHPRAPRVAVGDLSRPEGGDFGPRFGSIGHASHQNGLDVDVYYPRRDKRERPPKKPVQIDRRLAQDLVDRFVAAGAAKVFVGPITGLAGPPAIVEELPRYHDNHMHVRLPGDGVSPALIGESTRGQPIRAFRLGTGPVRALVVGCIHGDECAGSVVATRLLHTTPLEDGSIWVVQDLNPDGHRAKRRTNARGVDLNRNFPGTWRQLATSGEAPASEAETKVAMRLIRRLRPEVTIWFHQPETAVRAWGTSGGVARRYARDVKLPYRRLAWPPGAATAWQHQALPGTHAFVVELEPDFLGIREAGRYTRAVRELVD